MGFSKGFRARMAPAGIALLLLLMAPGCAPTGPQQQQAEQATTLLIVRHAEKAAEPADDPPLTDAGQRRAALLARMARSSGVSATYATQYLRTQQTVGPLASQLGLTVRQRDSGDLDGLVEQIFSEDSGGTVVIAAHSNTVPTLVEKLTGRPAPAIDESEYDNLYVVTAWGPGQGKALRLRYGDSATEASGAAE